MAEKKPDFAAGIASSDLKAGMILAGEFEGKPVVLVRQGEKVRALSGECTHLGAGLEQGIIAGGELRCPWHHARFAIDTGEAAGAPAIQPLSCFAVTEEDGVIRITGKADTDVRLRLNPKPEPDQRPIVIVGGGAAGHACADILERAGQGDRVLILSADADAPYDRTFCSKQYLAGKKARDECMLPSGAGEAMSSAEVRTGTTVTAIDTQARTLVTADGQSVPYETLVLAMGAEPIVPNVDGFDRENVHVLRTLADADGLIAAADKATNVGVLGASFIGLEVAASLRERKLPVTVIAKDKVPLAGVLGEEVGRFVRGLHEDKGVTFRLGRSIKSYDGAVATLDDGSTVAADLLVLGAGVKPRVGLAEAAGIALAPKEEGGGVRVDATLATSADGVFAIGDVASYPDPRLGHPIRVEHWVHAQRQGQYLARRLLGEVEEGFGDTPFFWSGHYDTSLRYVGHAASAKDRRIEGDVQEGEFAVFFRESGEEQALLTCQRDVEALEVEAKWDMPASA
ncbi:MAG: FAD-dependent oxidoreductase [Novosphingobium sp.]